MRGPAVAVAVLAAAAVPVAGATAAQTFPAGEPQAGPALTASGVAWAASDGAVGAQVLARAPTGEARLLGGFPGYSDGPHDRSATSRAVVALRAHGEDLSYTVQTYENRPGREAGGSLVSADAIQAAPGSGLATLASCGPRSGSPIATLGDGIVALLGCTPAAGPLPHEPPVLVNGTQVASGEAVAAAGRYAAWAAGGTVTVLDATSAAVVGGAPAAGAWALTADGSVVTAASAVGTTAVAVTPLGGAVTELAAEPGGVLGLTAAGGAIAYATTGAGGEQRIVVLRGGQRIEQARLWPAGAPATEVATDGTRVAWFSPRCGGADLTVATIGEPALDQRAGPCPIAIERRGRVTARALAIALRCDVRIPPSRCRGTLRVRVGGATIATGDVELSGYASGELPLTAAGRRLAARRTRVTATVEAVRMVDGSRLRSRARVRLR